MPLYSSIPFTFTWSGFDPGGAGIESYDVQYRIKADGRWFDWLQGTQQTEALFTDGKEGLTVYFRCRACGYAGNVADWPVDPDYDTFTTIDIVPPQWGNRGR